MPVAYVMAIVGLGGFAYLVSAKASFSLVATDLFSNFNSYSLSVIPLFVLMGYFAFHSGISQRLFDTASKLVGHLKGGLAISTMLGCAAFSAICGSGTATTATMAAICMPEMKKRNYDMAFASGTVASGGILGPLIPPSTIFIIYGALTRLSIGKLLIAGILPGILLTILWCIQIYIQASLNPSLAPPTPRVSLKEAVLSLPGGVGETLIIFVSVIGGLMVGFFTPTETAAVGAAAVLLVGLARGLKWKGIYTALADTTSVTAFIMLILVTAIIFGHFLTVTGIPQTLNNLLITAPVPGFVIIIGIYIVYLIGGMFIDGLALMVVTLPIFYPLILQLGYDGIWFGVIMVIVGGLGGLTPPMGTGAYIISGVAKIPLDIAFKGIWPFVGTGVACMLILLAFPQIATFLPSLM
jgi:tripartite ATP-independent transporter DctM subunit